MSSEPTTQSDTASDLPLRTNPTTGASLGREVRFGLTLLTALLATLGGVVYYKLGAPGFPSGKSNLADADAKSQAAAADDPGPASAHDLRKSLAQPVQVAEQGHAFTGSVAQEEQGGDRYFSRAVPPANAPLPVGEVAKDRYAPAGTDSSPAPFGGQPGWQQAAPGPTDEAASAGEPETQTNDIPPATPFDNSRVEPAAAALEPGRDTAVEPAASPAADPFQTGAPAAELAADAPSDEAPPMPAPEVELQAPQAERAATGDVRPAAGQTPTMAEPQNAPYGRNLPRDRYAPLPQSQGVGSAPGNHAAPANEHGFSTPGPQSQWNTPHGASSQNTPGHGAAAATPHQGGLNQHAPQHAGPQPNANGLNELDAPAAEFGAHQDDIAKHHHDPGHLPTHDGTYTVVPNDSFWVISQKVYGTGSYFKAVQRHNRQPGSQSDGLTIGEKILVPPVEVLEQKYPSLCPKRRGLPQRGARTLPTGSHGHMPGGRVYVVQEGDTLFDIARYELGKASRWSEIYELNRDQLGNDHDYVATGTRLILPDDSRSEPEPITTRPGAPYTR